MDFVPIKNHRYHSHTTEDGKAQIYIPRNSYIDRLVRKFKETPEYFRVDLDHFGSFTWHQIDGEKNIYEIGNALKEEFGEEIEPVYIRTGQFINLLRNNKLVTFK